jgi:hypothetical protein
MSRGTRQRSRPFVSRIKNSFLKFVEQICCSFMRKDAHHTRQCICDLRYVACCGVSVAAISITHFCSKHGTCRKPRSREGEAALLERSVHASLLHACATQYAQVACANKQVCSEPAYACSLQGLDMMPICVRVECLRECARSRALVPAADDMLVSATPACAKPQGASALGFTAHAHTRDQTETRNIQA